MLSAAQRYGIKVIVGTPTYAIPTWLARQHPDVLVTRTRGQAKFGFVRTWTSRTHTIAQLLSEVIENLIAHVAKHPAVIGYQVDNETKAYNTAGPNVQAAFVKALQEKWGSLDELNKAWGLDYWSNRVNRWEDFPSTTGTMNASVRNAFCRIPERSRNGVSCVANGAGSQARAQRPVHHPEF